MVLFVIFSTTLGGAVTLIGTPTNVYANTALEEAGMTYYPGVSGDADAAVAALLAGAICLAVMKANVLKTK